MKKTWALLFCLFPILLFSSKYASMYINVGTEQTGSPLFSAGTFYNVTGFTTSNNSSEWALASSTLTNTSGGGLYYVKYSLSYKGTAALWDAFLYVNGTRYAECDRKINFNQDVGNLSGGALIQIGDGQSIILQVSADTDITTFTPVYAQVVAYEVNEIATPTYAELYSNTESTMSGIGTSWINITGLSQGEINGWSFSSNALTASASAAGTYLALFSLSMASSSVADLFIGVSKNGVTPTIVARRYVSGTGDYGNAYTCGIITVAEGDVITLKTRADGSNKSLTTHFADFVLIPIAGTSQAPYASMDVEESTGGITLTSSWQKEPNQTNALTDANNWTFSAANDDLTPIGASAGKYLVSYNIGVTYPNPGVSGVDIDVDCGISIGGTIIEKSRAIRSLQKKDQGDFGAASGNAIITIDAATDIVFLGLKEHSGLSFDIVVEYSNVSLVRLKEEQSFTLPVELCSFSALSPDGSCMELRWETASETDIYGFNIYRDFSASGLSMTKRNGSVILAQHQSTGNHYCFVDEEMDDYSEYFYWLESTAYDGISEYYGPYFATLEQEHGETTEPEMYVNGAILNNYPNPFNPSTTIWYTLEEDTSVALKIYNISGKLIYEVKPEAMQKGSHSLVWDATDYASGVYFIKMETQSKTYVRKAILLK
jgi:hypothetical protein